MTELVGCRTFWIIRKRRRGKERRKQLKYNLREEKGRDKAEVGDNFTGGWEKDFRVVSVFPEFVRSYF